jgi:hypothetical protein
MPQQATDEQGGEAPEPYDLQPPPMRQDGGRGRRPWTAWSWRGRAAWRAPPGQRRRPGPATPGRSRPPHGRTASRWPA